MLKAIVDLFRDEDGAQLVEAILISVLVAIAAISGMTFLGGTTSNKMSNVGEQVG